MGNRIGQIIETGALAGLVFAFAFFAVIGFGGFPL